jgi:hypothetical protein
MSKMCGDTARYNRIRKQRVAKRALAKEMRSEIEARKNLAAGAGEKAKP